MEASRWVCGDRQGTLNPTPEPASKAANAEASNLIAKLSNAKIDVSTFGILNWPLIDVVYSIEVESERAEDTWLKLRNISIDTGYWPVIVNNIDELEGLVENISCHLEFDTTSRTWSPRKTAYHSSTEFVIDETDKISQTIRELRQIQGDSEPLDLNGNGVVKPAPQDLIVTGEKVNLDKWLHLKKALISEFNIDEENMPWPTEVEPDNNLQALLTWDPELGLRQTESVFILLVRAEYSWDVPAKLLYGGWNECPVPQIHVAFLKRWYGLHDAEIISIGRATIELVVSKPPKDRDQAFKIAQEQYLYCPDTVEQGAGSVTALAAELLKGRVWHFWWD
ncbi:MAG TPA: DUF4253 domain-containing protein [Drouetiella sp.]